MARTIAEHGHGGGLVELRAWYVESLRPKLAGAAGAGTIPPAAAVALDREMRGLLDLPHGDRHAGATPTEEAA